MSLEIITGLVVVLLGLIAGAFGVGHARGTSKAEAKAMQQRTEKNAAARVAVAEHKVEVKVRAENVQEIVRRMPNDVIDRELRERFIRPGSR